mmetsp:Transcript_16092/g.23533  ORF Transcript_16092/g.23533 Transcript_16092/m.23533 type:complete len:190 (+) Transcript_16092:2-571(+)
MPRAINLPLNFDPSDDKEYPVTFIDDETSLSFLQYNQSYTRLSYEDRYKLVKDAFRSVAIGPFGQIWKRDESKSKGARNILSTVEPEVEDCQMPDEKVPWRRVVVSHVNRKMARRGLRIGDVVTHLGNDPFDGNVTKLKFALAEKQNEEILGRTPSIQIVVNADIAVAEALRLRSLMARNPYAEEYYKY